MRDHNVGSLLVTDDAGNVVGILTERDIINRAVASRLPLQSIFVKDIMTEALISCRPESSVSEVSFLMVSRGIRHLPVVERGKPVAMVSSRDVLGQQLRLTEALKDAAEEIAMLIKCFYSIEIDEILQVAILQVRQIFQAKHWFLHFSEDETPESGGSIIRRKGCSCSVPGVLDSSRADGSKGLEGTFPSACPAVDCEGRRVLVWLNRVNGGNEKGEPQCAPSFLCMCGLPPEMAESVEVLSYKRGLVQDILCATLSNAKLYREAHRRSTIDLLTGLKMRWVLEEELAEEFERARRYIRPFSVAMLDVDNFKGINDHHRRRRQAAQAPLQAAQEQRPRFGPDSRYGGDEFVLLLPETLLDEAVGMLERLRRQAEEQVMVQSDGPTTFSCGVVQWSGEFDNSWEDVLRRADAALYEAKDAGRNCVVGATASPPRERDRVIGVPIGQGAQAEP